MDTVKENLLMSEVEYLRNQMSKTVQETGLTSRESVRISQQLDGLLNELQMQTTTNPREA
ncbi:aspartyl-phosphate phosphatase Spo0E family protein [Halobacillus fulvus]|nr:aspartyl-phosphate phosphatase Spo0E family protein [Halobacillus fulvus]